MSYPPSQPQDGQQPAGSQPLPIPTPPTPAAQPGYQAPPSAPQQGYPAQPSGHQTQPSGYQPPTAGYPQAAQPQSPYPAGGYQSAPQPPARSSNRTLWIVLGVVGGLAIIAGILVAVFAFRGGDDDAAQIAQDGVDELLNSTTLPMQLDQYTSWVDAEAQGSTIVYSYDVTGLLPADIDPVTAQSNTAAQACAAADSFGLLDQGVTFEYVYSFDGTSETMSFTVDSGDC